MYPTEIMETEIVHCEILLPRVDFVISQYITLGVMNVMRI